MEFPGRLPIDDALPALLAALEGGTRAVLAAPPGAGKTTRVPLALMEAGWATGRIVLLEPRRIAARAAAERMAETLGDKPGGQVGYRIRGESRPGRRIEVITEGILTRMLQSDPELPGISAVLFDEIHERSIHTDLGLALALEAQGALRPDLRLLAMSATLDTEEVSRVMGGAPVIRSEGRIFPVETRWLEKPLPRGARLHDAMAELIARAAGETANECGGDILAFLPGAGEIRRTAAALRTGLDVLPLYGALPFAEQRKALRKGAGRRVVLATSIAETSLTVEGVSVVVDCGKARRSRVDPATGLGRLVTVPVSRAEADQRRGRAGRLGPGTCYRLWTKGEEGALPLFAPPEITEADLTALALELALWGADDLPFLTPPPEARLAEARRLLAELGALDDAGHITAHGREMAGHALHPRLAHMLIRAEDRATAAALAALLTEGDPMREAGTADLAPRLAALAGRKDQRADPARLDRVRKEAARLHKGRPDASAAGRTLALAYPDRVAMRRAGDAPRYLLSGGRGAVLREGDPLGAAQMLVAADLEDGTEARIRLAATVAQSEIEALFAGRIVEERTVAWSRRERRAIATEARRLGALALEERRWKNAPEADIAAAMADGVRDLGLDALPWSGAPARFAARVRWARENAPSLAESLPDWSPEALLATLDEWLKPHLGACRSAADLAKLDLATILDAALPWEARGTLDRVAPAAWRTPLGRAIPLDYSSGTPAISVRLQEVFGVTSHPSAGVPPVPLVLELLSPAKRPIQTTRDLPGFWTGSYADVRKDMRARYPKHPWPEDPADAAPTLRAKPRS